MYTQKHTPTTKKGVNPEWLMFHTHTVPKPLKSIIIMWHVYKDTERYKFPRLPAEKPPTPNRYLNIYIYIYPPVIIKKKIP